VGYTDYQFPRNQNELRKSGRLHGYYHYAYPTYNGPEAEAEWFLKVVGTLQKGEVLFLDFEEKYGDPVGWSKKFLDRINQKLNYKPLIYLNKSLVTGYNWKPVIDADYGLWLALWDYNPDSLLPALPWKTVAFRQYSNKEIVKGVSGGVDANVFYGDTNTFNAYGYLKETTPEFTEEGYKLLLAENKSLSGQILTLQGTLDSTKAELEKLKKTISDNIPPLSTYSIKELLGELIKRF
jgi:hypothetical protein